MAFYSFLKGVFVIRCPKGHVRVRFWRGFASRVARVVAMAARSVSEEVPSYGVDVGDELFFMVVLANASGCHAWRAPFTPTAQGDSFANPC